MLVVALAILIEPLLAIHEHGRVLHERVPELPGDELGRMPHTGHFVDRGLHPGYPPPKRVLVVRVDASLVFANAHEVREEVIARLRQRGDEVKLVVLDLESSPVLDLSGVDMLGRLRETLADQRIDGRHLLSAAMPGVFAMKPGLDAGAVVRDFGAPRSRAASTLEVGVSARCSSNDIY